MHPEPSHRRRYLAIFTLVLMSLSLLLRDGSKQSAEPLRPGTRALTHPPPSKIIPGSPAAIAKVRKVSAAKAWPIDSEEVWDFNLKGQRSSIRLALDEAVLRDEEGKEKIQPLDPPATQQTLPARLAALKAPGGVFPVAYLDGEERSAASRRIVTPDLRVQLAAAAAEKLAAQNHLIIKDRPTYAPGWVIMSAADAFAALDAMVNLRDEQAVVSADVLLAVQHSLRTLPNDPLIGSQWHLKRSGTAVAGTDVNIETAWNYPAGPGSRGSGIRIGIIDDGLQTGHPDLTTNVDVTNDKDWNGNDADPNPGTGDDHGTACAGNAAARGNNNLGVSGTAPEATLVGMRLIAASVTDAQEAEAMSYLADLIEIRSNSWGPSDTGSVLEGPGPLTLASLETAVSSGRGGRGSVIVWAAGNGGDVGDNSNYDGYANSIYTIAIGATDSTGARSYYSEPGSNVVVCAPSNGGLGITTVDRTGGNGYNTAASPGGDYTNDFGGTSSACPTAAGVIACLLQKNPNLGWRDVQEILIRSAAKFKPTDTGWSNNGAGFHFNHDFGAGLIDATAAINLATGWTNLPAQTSTTSSQSSLSVAIPNNNATGVTRMFDLSASSLRVEQVTLKLSATHSARGDLEITLTSPTGMISRLAAVHGDTGANYSNWTFSSVRHWGEISTGTWTLKVADASSTGNTTGGTLTDAELKIFGSSTTPINPPPLTQITQPADAQIFSPGASVTINASASDLTSSGAAGIVTQVQFFDNDALMGGDATAPYSLAFSPALGNHVLVVKATDSQGATGTSPTVNITVLNQPPVISAVTLSATGQSYADVPLSVIAVTATDPENAVLTYSYQWQSGVNQTDFTDVPSGTSVTAPALPGQLLRCVVTASDGLSSSNTFKTASVNLLTRPVTTAAVGGSYSYTSGLVLRGTDSPLSRRAIINEFSQGPVGGAAEWIEILTLQAGSLAYWDLRDAAGNTLIFLDDPIWDNVPAGTLIVIYNGASKDPLLPADDPDPADGRMVISSTDAQFFDPLSDPWLPLGNSGDSIILNDELANSVHAVAYGNSTTVTPNLGSVGSGKSVYFAGDTDAKAGVAANWRVTTALTARFDRAFLPGVTLTSGIYSQDFNATPGVAGTSYPDGWIAYDNGTADATMLVGGSTSNTGANYNYGSRIGLLGSSSAFDPGSLVLALANTSGVTGMKISFDIIKVREQARSMNVRVQYSSTSATAGFTDVAGLTYSSASLAEGTVTSFSNIALPAAMENSAGTIYLRWLYETESGSGSRDGLALDNVVLSSATAIPALSLHVTPSTFAENLGPNAATATVSIPSALGTPLSVSLASTDTSEATLPGIVTIAAGQTSSPAFAVAAVDDTDSDGPQIVTLTASSTGYANGASVITVTDNEPTVEGVTPGRVNNTANQTFVTALRSGSLNTPALFRIGLGAVLPGGLTLDPLTGILSGTIAPGTPPGPYPIVIERYNSIGETVSQAYVLAITTGLGNTYADWIANYAVGGLTGVGDDFDRDGLPNGIENFLGTQPTVFNPGLTLVSATPGAIIFRHSKSNTPASDLTASYEWSANLSQWNASGSTSGGTTVQFAASTITDTEAPGNDLIEVTATITGTPRTVLFVRLKTVK